MERGISMSWLLTVTTPLASVSDEHEHWWFVFPFFWLLWLGVIATVLYFVFRRKPRRWNGSDRAKAILAERFARGEISGEEFRERLEQLS
jgi:putative membrane protein